MAKGVAKTEKAKSKKLGTKTLAKKKCNVSGGGRVLAPTAPHTHTLVFLHHQTGKVKEFFVDRKKWFDRMSGVRVVFPEAFRRYSEWYGSTTSFWYDYYPNPDNKEDVPRVETMDECRDRVLKIVQDEVRLLGSADRVFIGGESQGAVAAIHCALDPRMPLLGGVVCTSGRVEEETLPHPSKVDLPIRFFIAGKDEVYPPKKSVEQLKKFREAGFTDVVHEVHPRAIHASDWANGWINRFVREMQERGKAATKMIATPERAISERSADATPAAFKRKLDFGKPFDPKPAIA